jgi:hypothetical protein
VTGIALALALRGLDRALDEATIARARVELAGRYLSRQVGAPVAWACVLWGAR